MVGLINRTLPEKIRAGGEGVMKKTRGTDLADTGCRNRMELLFLRITDWTEYYQKRG